MIKQNLLMSIGIGLVLYLIIKSIVFYKNYNVNPFSFMNAPSKEKYLWLFFMVLLLSEVSITILYYLNVIAPWFTSFFTDLIGSIVLLLSILLLILAHRQMGKNWRMGTTSNLKGLVINGLYTYTRNPVYVGLLGLGFSVFLLIIHPLTLLTFILLLITLNLIVKTEEKFLAKQFGKQYLSYKEKVRRFI